MCVLRYCIDTDAFHSLCVCVCVCMCFQMLQCAFCIVCAHRYCIDTEGFHDFCVYPCDAFTLNSFALLVLMLTHVTHRH